MLLIVETEIWPNLLRAAFRRGLPTLLLSGRISERAFARYRLFRKLFRPVLNCFTALGMQSDADAARISALGANLAKVSVVGSLKFAERSVESRGSSAPRNDPSRCVFVAGSTHRGEEEIVLQAFRRAREHFPRLCLVLAPRHPERFSEVEKLLQAGFGYARKSLSAAEEYFSREVLLLDTVGELPFFFAAADVAFVGGSLVSVGGHNVAEPARCGKPILFGPSMDNFKAIAEELRRAGAAMEVHDANGLAHALIGLLGDAARRQGMGERAAKIVGSQADTLALNFELVQRYL